MWSRPHFAIAAASLAFFACTPAGAQLSRPLPLSSAPGTAAMACVVAPRPDSLWSLAQCCAQNLKSDPDCRLYDQANEFIILKDNSPMKPDAYLIIPTVKMTGVDDKQIFVPPFVDFWADGWQQAQNYLKKPPAETALAINSVQGRTQNQLHIHISCVRADVAHALAENDAKIGSDPATALPLALGPRGNTYRVIKVANLTASNSPYNLAAAMPGAKDDMADQSIAVIGSSTPGQYYVLDTYAHDANRGAAEELLEQTCSGS